MEVWQMTREEYIEYRRTQGSKHQRLDGQIHQNATAQAYGKGLDVPRRVLARYASITEHPLYRSEYEKRTGTPAPRKGIDYGPGSKVFNTQVKNAAIMYKAARAILETEIRFND